MVKVCKRTGCGNVVKYRGVCGSCRRGLQNLVLKNKLNKAEVERILDPKKTEKNLVINSIELWALRVLQDGKMKELSQQPMPIATDAANLYMKAQTGPVEVIDWEMSSPVVDRDL